MTVDSPEPTSLALIVRKLHSLHKQMSNVQLQVGRLVHAACQMGPPGVQTGVEATIAYLASQTPFEANTLNQYRKVYAAYLEADTGRVAWVAALPFAHHQEVMGRPDRIELLQTLVTEVGDPRRVTVAMVRAERRARQQLEQGTATGQASQPKIFADEPYMPINEALAAMSEWMRFIEVTLEQLGSPEYHAQRHALRDQMLALAKRLSTAQQYASAPPKITDKFAGVGDNVLAYDDQARAALVADVLAKARALRPRADI